MASRDPFVGRREELALLQDRLAASREGSGCLMLVSGPAGIGKSRLAEELVASADGVDVGWGAAIDDVGMPPLWPWTRAVRGFPGPSAELSAVADGAVRVGEGSAEDAAAAAFAAYTRALDAIEEHARTGPGLLLVLEDLHWADGSSLRLLDRLAADIRRLPVLVVATHRDPSSGPLHEALPGLLGRGGTETVALAPLAPAEATALLSETVSAADPVAVRAAVERSGGSPLYLRTLARVAADQLRAGARTESGANPELHHLVAAALRSAGPDAAGAVEALSVLGAEAEPDLLAGLLEVESAHEAVRRLLPAVPAGLVQPSPPAGDRVRLAHALVRDAVYDALPPTRRATLHRRAAELLEPLGASARAGEVARHWSRAGVPDRAAAWAARAAVGAREAGAHEEAMTYLTMALDALESGARVPALDRGELLLELARAEYLSGRIPEAIAACQRAAAQGERTGRADLMARAAVVVQGLDHPELNVAIELLCRRALAVIDTDAQPVLRARVEAALSCALFQVGDLDEAASWADRALTHATASADPHAELDAIRARIASLLPSDRERAKMGQRAIELSLVTGRPLAALWGHIWRCDAAFQDGNLAGAHIELAALEALAARTGLPLVRWHVLRRQAGFAGMAGEFDRARALSAQADGLAESFGDVSARGASVAFGIYLALLRGDPRELSPEWVDSGDLLALPPVAQAGVALSCLILGRREEAQAHYERLLAGLVAKPDLRTLPSMFWLIDIATRLRDAAGCRALQDILEQRIEPLVGMGFGTIFYLGSMARIRADLDLVAGDAARAVQRYEEGLRVDAVFGARPSLALGRMGLARALRETGETARAVDLARAAAADARRLDTPGLLREADEFLVETAARARAADPLSAREREVADLVAQALSNREVAQRLVLSERTVESHVRNILAKTGLSSRTELVRWVLESRA